MVPAQSSDPIVLDAKESFEILREMLKDYSDTYVSYTITTSASILLVIGWLLTSNHARGFLGEHSLLKIPLTLMIVVLLYLERKIAFRMKGVTDATGELIEQLRLPGVLRGHYAPRMISRQMVYSYLAAHLLMYGFLLALVWMIPSPSSARPATPERTSSSRPAEAGGAPCQITMPNA
jgi:hypothetical protein